MSIATEKKASLLPLNADGSPAGDPLFVQFNPEKYSSDISMTWTNVGETLQWTKTTTGSLILTLHFDSYEKGVDVTSITGKFKTELDPRQSNGNILGCLFQWGKHTYQGVVKSIKEDYSMFLDDGTPVRSVLTITLNPWPDSL